MRQRFRAALIVLIILLLVLIPVQNRVAHAQGGGTLAYGARVFGRILPDTPVVMYSFNGAAGDLVQVTARNWVGSLDPHLDLLAPDGQLAAVAAASPFAEDDLEASLSLFLPQSGIYMLVVSAKNGTTGEYMLKLQGRGPVESTPLAYGQAVTLNLTPETEPQVFTFEAEECPTALIVADLSEGLPFTFPFLVRVRNEQGAPIALLRGGDALEDRVIVAPLSGRYEVTVEGDDPASSGTIVLLVTCLDGAPGCVGGGVAGGPCGPAGESLTCYEDGPCGPFEVTVTPGGDGRMIFTWPAVEGAEWYIFSVIDSSGVLLADSPRLLEGETSHTYQVRPEDLSRGPFTAIVHAGGEGPEPGTAIRCIDNVTFTLDGQVTEQCRGIDVSIDIVPVAERRAVVSWSAVTGAGAYTIHVYAYDSGGGLVGIRVFTVPGSATTYHLNGVFPGEYSQFNIVVRAYTNPSGGGAFGDMPTGFLCSGSADIEFGPAGPAHWIAAAGS